MQKKKKHAKKFSIKNFGVPKTPPLRNSLCRPFSCILKGKEAPNIKISGVRGPLGWVWEGGVSAQILYVYALLWFLSLVGIKILVFLVVFLAFFFFFKKRKDLSIKSSALILSKNSGVSWVKQNSAKSAKIG